MHVRNRGFKHLPTWTAIDARQQMLKIKIQLRNGSLSEFFILKTIYKAAINNLQRR